MKVLHILASNKYSGAENVACQIINMFDNEIEMAYCSPHGDIENTLAEKNIHFFPLKKLSLKELKRVVKEYKPDIIHAHDLKAICLVSLCDKKIIKIGHIHVNDKSTMGKFSIKSILLKVVSRKFKHLFWVSKSCLDDYKYKQTVENKSSVLYNIIDESELHNLRAKDASNYCYDLIYLGRLTYQKNPIRLVNIAKIIKSTIPNFKMAIVGSGDLEDEIAQAIKINNLTDNIFCLGYKKNAYKLLSQTKIMIMTSRYEGTPMSALESLSLGVPIVSTKTDGMIDLIKQGENGYLYEIDEEAARIIIDVIKDKDLHKKLSENCKKFSEKYNNIEKYKRQIKDAYTR